MRRSPADRSVVAVEVPAVRMWGWSQGTGSSGLSIRSTGVLLQEEERKHANVASQAVRYSQAASVGGVQAGCGQQGCPGSGQRDPGRVRVRSEEQFVQDLVMPSA